MQLERHLVHCKWVPTIWVEKAKLTAACSFDLSLGTEKSLSLRLFIEK